MGPRLEPASGWASGGRAHSAGETWGPAAPLLARPLTTFMILSEKVKFMRVFNKYISIVTCLNRMSVSLCLSLSGICLPT